MLKRATRPLKSEIYEMEFEIRNAVKAMSCDASFSMNGFKTINRNAIALCNEYGFDIADRFGTEFPEYRDGHKSAACAYAQGATRLSNILTCGPVFREAFKAKELVFLTIADGADRKAPGELLDFNPETAFRRFQRAIATLRREYLELIAFASLEISASKLEDTVVFEPHIHALISGVPLEHIQRCFRAVLTNRQDKYSKPVKASLVSGHYLRPLCYMKKIRAELRSQYLTSQEAKRSSDNLMTGATKAEWLKWMSDRKLSDIQSVTGFTDEQSRRIRDCDLRREIDELLEKHRGLLRRRRRHPVPAARDETTVNF